MAKKKPDDTVEKPKKRTVKTKKAESTAEVTPENAATTATADKPSPVLTFIIASRDIEGIAPNYMGCEVKLWKPGTPLPAFDSSHVVFLNADDCVSPQYIAAVARVISETGADIVVPGMCVAKPGGGHITETFTGVVENVEERVGAIGANKVKAFQGLAVARSILDFMNSVREYDWESYSAIVTFVNASKVVWTEDAIYVRGSGSDGLDEWSRALFQCLTALDLHDNDQISLLLGKEYFAGQFRERWKALRAIAAPDESMKRFRDLYNTVAARAWDFME